MFAVNSGSNSIAVFNINSDGTLTHVPGSPFLSGGFQPVSLALQGNTLYVANKNQDPGQGPNDTHPNYTCFRVTKFGHLSPIPDSTINEKFGSSPAQVLTSPDGHLLFAVDFGVNVFDPHAFGHLESALHLFRIESNGRLEESPSTPQVPPANPPIALGLLAHPTENILYVGFVAAGQVGVYTYDQTGQLTFNKAVPNSGKLVCWFSINSAATFFYTSDNGDNSISTYDLRNDPKTPAEVQRLALKDDNPSNPTPSSPFELALDPTSSFLYVVGERHTTDPSLTGGNVLHILQVGQDGLLTEAPFSPILLPIPVESHPHGVVVL